MAKFHHKQNENIQLTAKSPAPLGPAKAATETNQKVSNRTPPGAIIPKGPVTELHTCMGLNSCENKGYAADNACAGQGDCATVQHACHTLNECKGQGGCGLFGTAPEFCHPGENDCKYQGSCGSPIIASRFIAAGPNRGKSVWQLARKRFEEKMEKAGTKIGKAPQGQEYGPTLEYVQARGSGSSCGQSGNRYGSYSFKNNAESAYKKREKFMKKSSKAKYSDKQCDY